MGTKFTHKECDARNQSKVCTGASSDPVVKIPVSAMATHLTPSAGRSHYATGQLSPKPQLMSLRRAHAQQDTVQIAQTLQPESNPAQHRERRAHPQRQDPAQMKEANLKKKKKRSGYKKGNATDSLKTCIFTDIH